MPLNVPNLLTLARIIAIPVFVIAYFFWPGRSNEVVVSIFILAAITDWLDGFLARKMGETSPFGAFLDPVADKLMVCTALVLLVADESIASEVISYKLFTVAVVIIISREVTVTALREWMAEVGQRASLATTYLSKGKTFLQMTAIIFLLYQQPFDEFPTLVAGELLLYLAAAITIWTMILYLRAAWPVLALKD